MATRIRYVNTASSGGDGTTNATSGGTAAYATLAAALAAEAADLTGITCDVADEQGNTYIALDILCTGTAADTSQAYFNAAGWVTNATHRLRVRLNGTGAGPKWDTGLYRLVSSQGYKAGNVRIGKAMHVTLQDLQVDATDTLDNAPTAVRLEDFAWDLCIVGGFYRQSNTSGSIDATGAVFRNYASGAYTLKMRNVAVGAADYPTVHIGGGGSTSATVLLYNCTIVERGATGRSLLLDENGAASTVRFKNLLLQGLGTNYILNDGTPDEALTILTRDTTSPTVGLRSKTITFVDATNWDYHLASGDTDAIGAGTDLSADSYWPFSTDGDGATRSSWDVGADEYSSGVALEQEGFRWYEDNGSESTASAAANQDTNITAAAGATKRLRMLINATGDPATKQYKLQYKLSTDGTWSDIA